MQLTTLHNKRIYLILTKDIQQARSLMKLFLDEFPIDEMHYTISHWMEAVPDNKEVNILFNKIKKLIRKYSFSILIEPDCKIPGYRGNRNLSVAATFMLLVYLTQRCWDLFNEKEFEEELFPTNTEEYKRMENFVREIDLSILMNSMFDIIKRTVGAEFFTSFWQEWEEKHKNSDREPEALTWDFNEQLIVNFMSLRGFVDVCFFIFNENKDEGKINR
jgi:hypothetical protein